MYNIKHNKFTGYRLCLVASVAALLIGFSIQSFAEVIDVTDKFGRSVNAKLVKCNEVNLEFLRMSDSKKFTVPLDTLDDKTRSAIKKWVGRGGNLSEKFEVTVNNGKSRRTNSQDDFDDRRVNLKPEVIVKNPNANQQTRKLQITVVFLGRPVEDRSSIYVFLTESFDLPKIAPLQSKTFNMKSISQAYDDRGYSKFGARYYGYVWIIHDDAGKAVDSFSVPSGILNNNAEAFLKLDPRRTYDRDLRGL